MFVDSQNFLFVYMCLPLFYYIHFDSFATFEGFYVKNVNYVPNEMSRAQVRAC